MKRIWNFLKNYVKKNKRTKLQKWSIIRQYTDTQELCSIENALQKRVDSKVFIVGLIKGITSYRMYVDEILEFIEEDVVLTEGGIFELKDMHPDYERYWDAVKNEKLTIKWWDLEMDDDFNFVLTGQSPLGLVKEKITGQNLIDNTLILEGGKIAYVDRLNNGFRKRIYLYYETEKLKKSKLLYFSGYKCIPDLFN